MRRIPLYMPGGSYVGTGIGGRFLETPPCRDKRCPVDGAHKHVFDLETGLTVPEPAGTTEMHGMRGDARGVPSRKVG